VRAVTFDVTDTSGESKYEGYSGVVHPSIDWQCSRI
jgi:hypothetical protein